jgi:hypothetical protein
MKTSYWRYKFVPLGLHAQQAFPRFAHKRRMPHCANTISCGSYVAPILMVLRLFFQNLPIIWAVLTGNGKKV